jgi:ATP-dependent Clp protease ATP-binding subunit ClpA
VFERFTERAREVVVLAQDEARALKHNYIGTEHLLLGLLREEEGLASRVLASLDITIEEVRAQIEQVVGRGDEAATGQIPFTPRAKKVLELSLREAMAIGHNYIGTEHILLGLVRESEGVAARILLGFDADAEKIRNEVLRFLSGPERRQAGTTQPVDPVLDPEIRKLRAAKDEAIEKGQFERAAQLRGRERELVSAFARQTEGLPSRPHYYEYFGPVRSASFFPGWLLFGISLGIGVLVGWAIWGL